MNSATSLDAYRANRSIQSLRELLGVKKVVSVCQTRERLLEMRKMLLADKRQDENVDYIDYILKKADEGRIRLAQ